MNARYEVGQHVQIQPFGEAAQSGVITRLPVPANDELLDGSPFFVVEVYGVDTLVPADEILAVIPDLTDVHAVEAWLKP